MNVLGLPSHWPEAARLSLERLTSTVLEGCGSCVHASWGARPHYLEDALAAGEIDDFRLVACSQGAAIRDKDGGLEVLQFCSRWNSTASAAEPPPIPESAPAGAARSSLARPGLIPPASRS